MMDEILKIIGLALFSGVKFFFAVPATALAGYGFLGTFLISLSGGFVGLIVFFYFGEWMKHFLFKRGWFKRKKDRKIFTKLSRRIIRIKNKYGLFGLSLLTPVLFSIPIGALIAARYFDHDKRTFLYMTGSIFFWSVVLSGFYNMFK